MDEDTRLSKGERDFLLSELEKNNNGFYKDEIRGFDKSSILLLDELNELIFIINNEGKIVFVNNIVTSYGYSKEELDKKFVFEFFQDKTKNLLEYFFNKKNINKLWIFKDQFLAKNGDKIPFEFKLKQFYQNETSSFILICKDLNEIVQYQKEIDNLKKEQTITEKAIQKSGIGVWQWDILSDKIVYDDMYKVLLGYQKDPFEGSFQKLMELIHEGDKEKIIHNIKEHFFERVETFSSFYRIKNVKGEFKYFCSRGVVVERDKFSLPKYMIGIYTMINECEEKFKEIAEGKNYLKKIIDNMDQGLVVIDSNFKFKLANSVFYSTLNMPDNIVYFKDIVDNDYISTFEEKMEELKNKKEGTVSFECKLINKNNEYIYAFITGLSYDGEAEEIILIITDITQRKKFEELLRKYATIDDLTDAYNRRAGFLALEKSLEIAKLKKEPMSVIFIDVDNLKTINDNFGHDAGDFVLRKIADIIRNSIRESDILIRVGGDEFVLGLPSARKEDAQMIIKRIKGALNNIKIDEDVRVDLSYGICEYSDFEKDLDIEDLIKAADNEMYQMKKSKEKGM
jgi:diguanylate cyclase (GGDEF)-like protein/PAS domain S-box-containing protein